MDAEVIVQAVIGLEPTAKIRPNASHPAVEVPVERLRDCMQQIRDNAEFSFDMLLDHTAIDWSAENRMELVYLLYSTRHGHYLMVFASVPREKPVAPTVSDLWLTAQWQEREAYDLLGIQYDNHPDLRRLFLEDDWSGHPLRKDYRDDYILEFPQ